MAFPADLPPVLPETSPPAMCHPAPDSAETGPAAGNQWGAIAVSIVGILTFDGALVISFVLKDPTMMALTVGAAVAMGTTVVNYWLGSSAGSQKKDETIAKSRQAEPAKPS